MAQSRIQLGPCCTVPRGGEPYVDRWDVWCLPAWSGRGARDAEIALAARAGAQAGAPAAPSTATPAARGPGMTASGGRRRAVAGAVALLGCASLAACGGVPDVGADVAMAGMPNPELALRESMRAVDAEMGKLGGLRLASAAGPAATGPVVPAELQKVVTFAWTGTLEGGVRKLATDVGYAVSVVPPPPRGLPPLQVDIRTAAAPVIEAFQALGTAAGTRAEVRVDPALRQVQVLYRPGSSGGLTS